MKAVVIEGPDRAVYRDVETPSRGPGEVVVRSLRAGVCRTDHRFPAGRFEEAFRLMDAREGIVAKIVLEP